MMSRERWAGIALAGAVAAVLVVISRWHLSPLVPVQAAGATIGVLVAAALVAVATFRAGRNTGLLVVATGAAVAALQLTVFDVVWPILATHAPTNPFAQRTGGVPGPAIVVGWAGLAVCLLAATPLRDRRGRTPPRPTVLVAATVVPVLLIDVILVLAPPARRAAAIPIGFIDDPGPVGWVAGAIAVAAGLGAAVVATRSPRAGASSPWVAGAGLAGAVAAASIVALPTADTRAIARALALLGVAMPLVQAALTLAIPVVAQRADSSRMRRASDRASEVMQGRAEIASMIAHDVRGPVGTVKSLATTTRKSYDRLTDDERLEFIAMIESEAARLLGLVDQTAVALKVDAGTLDITPREQPLANLVRHGVESADTAGRTVDLSLDDGVTAWADTRWIPETVRQGLDNAVRFSPPGTKIEVRLAGDDATASIEIADAGPGIPSEHKDEVFERFARWRPVGYEDRTGSGLGLFIVRGISRAHGGDASLTDGPDGGTILRIRLPREGTTP